MWKKFLAASAVATGIVGLLAGGNAFADLPEVNSGSYAPGQTIYAVATNSKICIEKNGGYDGGLIIADVWGTNFQKQITFDSFSEDSSCKLVGGIPSDGRMRFVTPMGFSNMSFFTQVEDGYVDGEIYLELDNATMSNKYLRSYGWGVTRTESQRPESTVLVTGQEFNRLLKRLVGNSNVEFYDNDSDITSIEFVDRLPDSINRDTTPKVNIATSGNEPVYAYQDENGHVYINTLAKKIRTSIFCNQMFLLMGSLESLVLPDTLDTSGTMDMASMFSGIGVESLSLPETFDTSSATNMDRMFYGMPRVTSISLPETFNTSNVTNMPLMFAQSSNLSSLSLPNAFNTSKVTDMDNMFYGTGITSLVLPASFKTSNVTNMRSMFRGMTKLTTLTLPESFDTSKVTDMGYMFYKMGALTHLYLPDQFIIGQNADVEEIFGMISSTATLCSADSTARSLWPGVLCSVRIETGSNVNQALKSLEVRPEDDEYGHYEDGESIQSIQFVDKLPDSIDAATARKVNIALEGEAPLYAYADDAGQNVYVHMDRRIVIVNQDASNMFSWFFGLTRLDLSDSFDTSNVTNMSHMFYYTNSLTSLALPHSFNTSNVTDMSSMFSWMESLTSLTFSDTFDTSNVTDMNSMFYVVESLTSLTLPDTFNTSNVTDMSYMFCAMRALTSLTFSSTFYTSNVTNMLWMFRGAKSLTSLTLPNTFDTSSVRNFISMFNQMFALTSLTLPDTFIISNNGAATSEIFQSIQESAVLYATDSRVRSLWPGVLGN